MHVMTPARTGTGSFAGAIEVAGRTAAVAIVTGALLAIRLFFTVVPMPGVVLVRTLGVARLATRLPYAAVIASQALLAFVLWPGAAPWPGEGSYGAALRVVLFLVAVGIYYEGADVLLRTGFPRSLDELRAVVSRRWPERWFATRLANPLDAIFVRLVIDQTLLVVPCFVLMVVPGGVPSIVFFAFVQGVIGKRHETLAHSEIHYHPFASKHLRGRWDRAVVRTIELYVVYVLSILCMRIPRWYGVQHIAIHHAEDNGIHDTQSMLAYDRASYFDLCVVSIMSGFSYVVPVDIVQYLRRRRRTRLLRHFLGGMAVYYAALTLLAMASWPAALFLLAWVFFASGTGAAVHNLWWHAFIDPHDPKNSYRSSMNVESGSESLGNFGSDYHLEHHLHPERHWTLLHEEAIGEGHGGAYAAEEAFVLRGARRAFLRALWTRRFEDLAEVIRPTRPGTTRAELAALAEERTRPIAPRPRSALATRLDTLVGGAMAYVAY
jgi:hypothetical protein